VSDASLDAAPVVSTDVADGATELTDGATAVADAAAPRPKRRLVRLVRLARRFALPSLYAAALLGCGALYFYADYRSTDARLARARQARIDGRHEGALEEYRAALRQADDPHVRKILGLELSKAGRWEEALGELRAAERGGEPDDALPFHVATALAALDRPAEARDEYRKFLQSRLCAQAPPDSRCEGVRAGVAP
jgi:tetratricopeptide (TPR) repeat protein